MSQKIKINLKSYMNLNIAKINKKIFQIKMNKIQMIINIELSKIKIYMYQNIIKIKMFL